MEDVSFESYPPLFRPTSSTAVSNRQLGVDYSDLPDGQLVPIGATCSDSSDSESDSQLPVIDFECMNEGEELSKACKDWGFFRLVNHGVPITLLNELHEYAQKLFSFSFESKQASFTSPVAYFWGSPALSVALQSKEGPPCQNLKWMEGLNVPLNQLSQLHYEDSMLESFRSLLEEYGKHQCRLVAAIFNAMAENLKLGPEKSESYLSPATGFLRVYRYPRCSEPDQAWGIDVHTDSSVLSLLHQDGVGGLQVYKDHRWFDVKPIPGTLIVNIGDMLQAISNDEYASVKHRVKVNKNKERISIGYFIFPADDAVIESSKYKPFTYAKFRAEVEQDLKTVGSKIGLSKFKLINRKN